MKIVDPLKQICVYTTVGCTDDEFQGYLIEGRNEIQFKNFEGCVEIPMSLTSENVPDELANIDIDGNPIPQKWEERFITFIMQDGKSYLILGSKRNEYSWGAMASTEIFDIYEYFKTLAWFDLSIFHTSDYLKARVSEWVAENTPEQPI